MPKDADFGMAKVRRGVVPVLLAIETAWIGASHPGGTSPKRPLYPHNGNV
jgi:hypothetical protein